MKIPTLFILILAIGITVSVRPPSPVCRTTSLPSVIPINIGETVKFDLQDIFSGYNLQFDGKKSDHIEMTPKYTVNSTEFTQHMPFRSVKINHNGRFLGLISHDDVSQLAIGFNHPESGIQITTIVHLQDQPNLHCFDVEEVNAPIANKTYAMIDCGVFEKGVLDSNEFLLVDLENNKKFLGSKETDVYVNYNYITARQIHLLVDPITRIEYLFRVILSSDVDAEHADQTYIEIFMMGEHPAQAQIIDVIDHTFLDLPSLNILDYQIHFNEIYLLIKDKGIYRFSFSANQRILFTGFLEVKVNAQQFRVQQLGFNDGLHVVVANDNTIYQYEWDAPAPPSLVYKYALIAGTVVEELLVDANFVIVQGTSLIDDKYDKKIWVFSRRTPSYTHAFGAFDTPVNESSLIIYEGDGRTLHLIQQLRSFNIKINLPDLKIFPVTERASETEDYVIVAKSTTATQQVQCRQTVKFIYIDNKNTSVIRTDLEGMTTRVVDSPDQSEIMLDYQFFGPFMNYNISFAVQNSSLLPRFYLNKQHKAVVNFPFEIKQQNITYLEMFPVKGLSDLQGTTLHGLVEYRDSQNQYPIAYISCDINTDDYDEEHTFRCYSIQTIKPMAGKLLLVSQVPSLSERFVAMVFEDNDRLFKIYYYSSRTLDFYCQAKYNFTIVNNLNDVEIMENKLVLATFELGKRIEIHSLDNLKQAYEERPDDDPVPLFTIDKRIMAFFGIQYFAPVDVKLSPYHKQVAFVKTKNGVMAININRRGMPELLFHLKTDTARYDFQITHDSLLIVTEYNFEMYRLVTPLRRVDQPFLLQKYDGNFTLSQYGEMDADGFFYLVENEKKNVLVLHPNMPSTSIFYTELAFSHVSNLDATRIGNRQFLFVNTDKDVEAWVLNEHPTLKTYWQPSQNNFTMNISAYNVKENATSQSQPYTFNYSVIKSDEADIKTTDKFNIQEIRKAGHVKVDKNAPRLDKNITLNDSDWFTGTVTHFNISCKHCNQNVSDDQFQVIMQNHVSATGAHIHAGQPVYDMKPTFQGIYGQQYNAFFKTFSHNNSVQYTAKIPTGSMGEVCTKMFVPVHHQFLMSFCETGNEVNAYITSLTASKPFTIGPIRTQAVAVNKVILVGDILMIVDNEDNPYSRSGGVYLYLFDFMAKSMDDMLVLLDYLDYEDLQMEGFEGMPFIASADIHKPHFNKEQYSVFITESRSGSMFVFTFEVSDNREEAVYLARKMLPLNKLIPESARHPQPLRIQSIQIVDYTIRTKDKRVEIEYVFLLTVRNWHHIQIEITLDEEADILFFNLARIFERVPYPWELTNYIALRNGALNSSYFAVSYLEIENDWQIVAIYELPRFNLNSTKEDQLQDGIPITRMLGAYLVRDANEITFAFNILQQHKMLLNDVGDQHLKDIEINKELIVKVKNLDPTQEEPQNVTVIAFNHYTSYNFSIELTWEDENEEIKRQILWIIITVIGVIMIIGLLIIWCRQSKKEAKDQIKGTTKESLLTVENQFKPHFINRSSVDPESQRATVDFTNKPSPYEAQQPKEMIREENEEIDENDPLEERIRENEQVDENERDEQKKEQNFATEELLDKPNPTQA